VRPLLERRFDMGSWFVRHGYPASIWARPARRALLAKPAAPSMPTPAALKLRLAAAAARPQQGATTDGAPTGAAPRKEVLLLCDFDKTITDFDAGEGRLHQRAMCPRAPRGRLRPSSAARAPGRLGNSLRPARPDPAQGAIPRGCRSRRPRLASSNPPGERLVGELAPELAPQLASIQMPANFVPLTNDVLSEMARRGVTRDALLAALQRMGAELPPASVRMLRHARGTGVDVKLLSDCNAVFIDHVLAGARLSGCVGEVITNSAAFERVPTSPDDALGLGLGAAEAAAPPQQRASPHRLVIVPRRAAPHACPLCPSNLCKGEELAALRGGYRRVVFAGDGENDICPARLLGPGDVVLARAGHGLARFLQAAAAGAAPGGGGGAAVAARWFLWDTHEELAALVERFTAPPRSGAPAAPATAAAEKLAAAASSLASTDSADTSLLN
jgi:hypothetical protein